jgi:hypothetical protein
VNNMVANNVILYYPREYPNHVVGIKGSIVDFNLAQLTTENRFLINK